MRTLFILCLLSVSFASLAQNKHHGMMPRMVHGIGVSFQKFDGLDGRIANFPQFEELRDHMGTLQLGWLKERNRLISGLSFMAGSSMSGERDKKSSTLRFLGFSADFGYDVIANERIMLYPLAGIGFEKYQARLFRDNSEVPFNEVLQNPAIHNNTRPVDFKNAFLTYRLGAGVALSSAKSPSHSIGLQAGYIGSFKSHEWKSAYNQELMNAPEDRLKRIFISLTFMSQPKFMK